MNEPSPPGSVIRVRLRSALPPARAFDLIRGDLQEALKPQGLHMEAAAEGRVVEGPHEVGKITVWEPGRRMLIAWSPAPWNAKTVAEVEIRTDRTETGSLIVLELRGWETALEDAEGEVEGWFAEEVLAPLFRSVAPAAFGNWTTGRQARRR